MKKIVAGGFLSLVASIWALAIVIFAENNLVSDWDTEIGRLLSTIIDMKMIMPLILCVAIVVIGIMMMLFESFKKEK